MHSVSRALQPVAASQGLHAGLRWHRPPAPRRPASEPRSLRASASSPVRVLLADPQPVFRAGLRALIAGAADLEVAGEAGDASEVARLVLELGPDVVVSGFGAVSPEGVRVLRSTRPGTPVLVLAPFDEEREVAAAVRHGARGYAAKEAEPADTLAALRAVGRGGIGFSPGVSDLVLALAVQGTSAQEVFPELSEREREVLDLLARGRSNGQIAQRLFLSPKTVRNYVSSICNKLEVVDRVQAALRARDAGLGLAEAVA